MTNFLIIIVIAVVMNSLFSFIPYLIPRAPAEMIIPYQMWFNVVLIFISILPHQVSNFDFFYNNK